MMKIHHRVALKGASMAYSTGVMVMILSHSGSNEFYDIYLHYHLASTFKFTIIKTSEGITNCAMAQSEVQDYSIMESRSHLLKSIKPIVTTTGLLHPKFKLSITVAEQANLNHSSVKRRLC